MKKIVNRLIRPFLSLVSALLVIVPTNLIGQVDGKIELSASFSSSIEIRIDGNPEVSWKIETVDKYENGFWPVERPTAFSVASSVNFRIDYVNTPFQTPEGVSLDIQNLAYRLEPASSEVKANYNKKYAWGPPDSGKQGSANLSGIFIASFTPKTILVAGPNGNAGSFESNAFKIRVGIGSRNIRAITGLSSLLEQNIAPGTYTTVLTLTAYPDPDL